MFKKRIHALEQKKKQSKERGFEILNGRGVDCSQIAIERGLVKKSLTEVRFEQRFEKLEEVAKLMAEGRAVQAEATSRAKGIR